MELTSAQNTFLKSVRRAAATGRTTEDGLVVAEGPHLLEEALRSFWSVEKILTTANGFERYRELLRASKAEIVRVSGRAFAAVASTETAQEVLALLRPRAWSPSEIWQAQALLVALEAVHDPGNAGTIVRSAEAFGATGVIFLQGCVRVANGKFLRASAGSIFRLPFVEEINSKNFIREATQNRIQTYALTATGQMLISEVDLSRSCCLITGNEGAGISKDLLAQAQSVSIPTLRVESLNAAVACSLALFEAYKQRAV
ncbi:MAG: RNA methyltransferase [Acidobacteriaceae bacterium]|nr:RNA methyltransferase [Acidobacteriaceae bacterium]